MACLDLAAKTCSQPVDKVRRIGSSEADRIMQDCGMSRPSCHNMQSTSGQGKEKLTALKLTGSCTTVACVDLAATTCSLPVDKVRRIGSSEAYRIMQDCGMSRPGCHNLQSTSGQGKVN